MVYVLSIEGKPLMPTKRHGKVRRLLKQGLAKVVKRKPFTIQLLYETTTYTQPITLGIDSGYNYIGFSAVTEKEELISGEVKLLQGISERLKKRAMYRRQRRNRLRYRKPKFNNRRKPEGWLPPSIQHKYDSHVRFINLLKSILSITEVVVEVASFDIQKIKNPDIEGTDYQNGEQKGFYNLREYILYRDNYTCQLCGKSNLPLEVHHIGYWKLDRTDRPGNLITLCIDCHTPKNHLEDGNLWRWQPKIQSFKEATFMSTVRRKLVNTFGCQYNYGYITKTKRKALSLEKTHYNDAFVIAGGGNQKRIEPIYFEQVRRNNRSLEKFYDAKYIDIRTGKPATGQKLFNGRRIRNKNYSTENLRKFRGQRLSKGQRRIRAKRYFYQPKDMVVYEEQKYIVKGVQNRGSYVKLEGLPRPVRIELVRPYLFRKGFTTV
jgi:hypothetical protein